MALYDKPVRALMWDMVADLGLTKGQVITRDQVLEWFAERYPKVKQGTIGAHLIRLSTNARSRHHYSAKPKDDDLFYQVDGGRFRLYDSVQDPQPFYDQPESASPEPIADLEAEQPPGEFAYESDLRNYLAKNLALIEPGLSLYEDECIRGVEFPAGGRFIDILAVDTHDNYVVIELKVSRGYDRTVGQILRYMGWIQGNLAETHQTVRGLIISREISEDLLLACSRVSSISLYEYTLSVDLRKIQSCQTDRR